MGRQCIGASILDSSGTNCYHSMDDQILYFMAKGPTVMPQGIHVKLNGHFAHNLFGGGSVMGIGWPLPIRLAPHSFWYSCDNYSGKGKKPEQPCLNYEDICLWSVLW